MSFAYIIPRAHFFVDDIDVLHDLRWTKMNNTLNGHFNRILEKV